VHRGVKRGHQPKVEKTMKKLIINLTGHPMPERGRGTVILSPRYQLDAATLGLGQLALEHAVAPLKELLETCDEWVIKAITRGKYAVALPGMSFAAGACLAHLHGISGHFPKILWSYRTEDGFAWIDNPADLQTVREHARVDRPFML